MTEPQTSPAAKRRLDDLQHFYAILNQLATQTGGPRRLSACSGRDGWPVRGVYFFLEDGEERSQSGGGPRIVRVGSHALTAGSKSTLWDRLAQHKGPAKSGGGNHRGSVFRKLVGTALLARDGDSCATWGQGNAAPRHITAAELPVERRVSDTIGRMRFVCLPVDDAPHPNSMRGVIERNAIALLSNYHKPAVDAPSANWLGRHCNREKVRCSGLWNQKHVNEEYDPAFLETFNERVMSLSCQ